MSRPNKAVYDIMKKRFEEMLENGDFPAVGWEKSQSASGVQFRTYNMMEYSMTWARYAWLVSNTLQKNNVAVDGIFTRLRNSNFLSILQEVCNGITADMVNTSPNRFGTWMD